MGTMSPGPAPDASGPAPAAVLIDQIAETILELAQAPTTTGRADRGLGRYPSNRSSGDAAAPELQ